MKKSLAVGAMWVGLASSALAAEPVMKAPLAPAPAAIKYEPPLERRLSDPDYLSTMARRTLKKKMARHGQEASDLMLAIALLQHEAAQRLAKQIAAEPRVAKPIAPSEDELGSKLPEPFFAYQDELRNQAKELAVLAANKDSQGLTAGMSKMLGVCVSCHTVYLAPRRP